MLHLPKSGIIHAMIGRDIQNRYHISEKLGIGGMGAVYKTRDTSTGALYAIKMIYQPQEVELNRFKREFLTMSKIKHPNIVQVFNHGIYQEYHFIIMEYIEGVNLKKYFNQQKSMLIEKYGKNNFFKEYMRAVLHVFMQISSALSHIHALDIIHRDLKPTNIMITANGIAKLMDFGLSKQVGLSSGEFTIAGSITGTVSYMSPEQSSGKRIDIRSDFYSLGIILFEILTGSKPFQSDNPIAILMMHIKEAPPLPRSFNPEIPPAMERIILKLLAKDPIDRYQSADDLLEDLSAIGLQREKQLKEISRETPAVAYRLFTPAFVGRKEQVDIFTRCLDEMMLEQGSAFFISGQTGIGKKRLLAELAGISRKQGFLTLEGRYLPEHKGALQAFEEIFEKIIDLLEKGTIPVEEQRIDEIYGFISRFIPNMKLMGDEFITHIIGGMFHDIPQDMNVEIQFKKLFNILSYISITKPLIFLISNLEYANKFNHRLVKYLIARTIQNKEKVPISFVVTLNDKMLPVSSVFSREKRADFGNRFTHMPLKGMNIAHTQTFIQQMLGISEVPASFVRLIHADTQGSPLNIIESLRFLCEQSILYKMKNRWCVDTGTQKTFLDEAEVYEIDIPINTEEIYRKRVSHLNTMPKRILEYMSLFDERVDLDVLLSISNFAKNETLSSIDILLKRDLILEDREGNRFYLNPPRLKDIITSSIPEDEKTKMYQGMANAYEELYRENIEPLYSQLAYLWDKAGATRKAFFYYIKAGERAISLYFYDQAIDWLKNAIRIAQKLQEDEFFCIGLIRSYIALGEVEETKGNTAKAMKAYEKAYSIAKGRNRIIDKAKSLMHIGWLHFQSGKNETAKRFFTKGRELYSLKEDKVGIASAMNRIALTELKSGKLKDALRIFLEALIYEKEVGNAIWIAKNLSNIGYIYTRLGNFKVSIKYLDEAMEILKRLNNKIDLIRCLNYLGLSYFYLGNLVQAVRENERSLSMAREIDFKLGLCQALNNSAIILRILGLFDKSLDYLEESIEIRQGTKDTRGEAIGLLNKGILFYDIGNYDEAEQYIRKSMEIDDDMDLDDTFSEGYLYLAKISYQRGNDTLASDFLHKTFELARKQKDYYRLLQAGLFRSRFFNIDADSERVIVYLLQLKKKALKYGFKLLMAGINARIAEIMMAKKRYKDALHFLKLCLPIYQAVRSKPFLVTVYILMGDLLYVLQHKKRASSYFQRGLQLAEEIQADTPIAYVSYFIAKKEIQYLYKKLSFIY